MKSYENTNSIVCLGCASIIRAPHESSILCPVCGYSNDRALCVWLLEHAAEAALCGYQYRVLYESKQRGLLYLPSPEDALVWIALAALGGIIGNATYELTKRAISRIVAQLRKKGDHEVLASQDEFELFIRYVEEYERGMPSATPKVRRKVMMEVSAHLAQREVPNESDAIARNPVLRAKLEELRAKRNVDAPDRTCDSWPKDLWTRLPDDSSDEL